MFFPFHLLFIILLVIVASLKWTHTSNFIHFCSFQLVLFVLKPKNVSYVSYVSYVSFCVCLNVWS